MVDYVRIAEEENEDEQPLVVVDYTVTQKEIKRVFYVIRQMRGSMNKVIFTFLILLLYIVYLLPMVQQGNYLAIGASVIPVAILVYMWAVPFIRVDLATRRIARENNQYHAEIYSKKLLMAEDGEQTELLLDRSVYVTEDEKQFNIIDHENNGTCIPKHFMNDEQIGVMRKVFAMNLNDNFTMKR